MAMNGGCHCGEVRYELQGDPLTHALCHCTDCRRHAGAPVVGWTMYPESALKITKGAPRVYKSSLHGRRHFCGNCGTGLLYYNQELLPGIVDVQSATCDHPEKLPAPVHIQVSERIPWMEHAHELPSHLRYPPSA